MDDLPEACLHDPIWERSGHTFRGRDGCRIPLPWAGDRPPFGFSTSPKTWLPVPDSWASLTVEAEIADPGSMLTLYRDALRLRHEQRALGRGEFRWVEGLADDILAFDLVLSGETVRVVANFGAAPVALPAGKVLLASSPLEEGLLASDAAAWVRRRI